MSDDANQQPNSVLQAADALMRRHRRVFVAGAAAETTPAAATTAEPTALTDADDIPVLTDAVDDLAAPAIQAVREDIAKHIHAAVTASEAELTQALERWIEAYLPKMLAHALDGVAEQLRAEIAAKLRAEILNRPIFQTQPASSDPTTPPV